MNLLFCFLIILPLLNCCISANSRLGRFNKIIPILFLTILIGIFSKLKNEQYFEIISFNKDIALAFIINKSNILSLVLLNFIWLIFSFYIQRFYEYDESKNAVLTQKFLAIFILIFNFLIISENALTLLFFFNFAVLGHYFLIVKTFIKNINKKSQILFLTILFEPLFLFFAIFLTIVFAGQINFSKAGILENLNHIQLIILFLLYFGTIFITIFLPFYLLYYNNHIFDPIANYVNLALFYGFIKLFMFIKIAEEIFGFATFSAIIFKLNFEIFSLFFLINIGILAYLLLQSRDFKMVFFYLFHGQFIFAIFTIFVFILYDENRVSVALRNFMLVTIIMFIIFSNLILYLKKAQNKDLNGLFYDMKVSSSLMLFLALCLLGLVPSVAMIEKFSLLKTILRNDLNIAILVYLLNFLYLLLFFGKIFVTIFARPDSLSDKPDSLDKNIAKNSSSKNKSKFRIKKINSASDLQKSGLDNENSAELLSKKDELKLQNEIVCLTNSGDDHKKMPADGFSLRCEHDRYLAYKIDSSASLILTSLVVVITIIFLPIIEFLL